MALYLKNEDWRLIAEEVTKETDPKKLMTLITQLCHALNCESDDMPRQQQHPENPAFPDASKPEQHAH